MFISTIFFDMDGVLADFVGGAMREHGCHIDRAKVKWDFMNQIGFDGPGDMRFWEPFGHPAFWSQLDPLLDGMELFERITELAGPARVAILSSGLCPGSADGKREWVRKHLPDFDIRKVCFATAKEVHAAPCKLLLDDFDKNIDLFRENRGEAILIPRPWNRLNHLAFNGNFDADEIVRSVKALLDA